MFWSLHQETYFFTKEQRGPKRIYNKCKKGNKNRSYLLRPHVTVALYFCARAKEMRKKTEAGR